MVDWVVHVMLSSTFVLSFKIYAEEPRRDLADYLLRSTSFLARDFVLSGPIKTLFPSGAEQRIFNTEEPELATHSGENQVSGYALLIIY